jgi:hypothetical protein
MESNNYLDLSHNDVSQEDNVRPPQDHALNLQFSIGFSSEYIGAVQNITLSDKKVRLIFNLGNFLSFSAHWCSL